MRNGGRSIPETSSGSLPAIDINMGPRPYAMTHIAIAEDLVGKAVDWMEHVTDEQYRP